MYFTDTDGRRTAQWNPDIGQPMGIAAGEGVYLGDNAQRRLLAYDYDGVPVGAAYGWAGPVAALAVGPDGRL